jgi:hypothetical protein
MKSYSLPVLQCIELNGSEKVINIEVVDYIKKIKVKLSLCLTN